MASTNDFYREHLQDFCASTVELDVSELYARFIAQLPKEGEVRVLDFGCGAGRDVKAFKEMGFEVDAIDASPELCEVATRYSGVQVRCMRFMDLNEKSLYSGIWACASLLHASSKELPIILDKMCLALKPDGVINMSFKYGDFEGERDGRFFLDMTEERMMSFLKTVPELELVDIWKSEDVRPDRRVIWLNVLVRKESAK